jgi:hypothetical protein
MLGFDAKDGVTLSIAAVGAVLGIINTRQAMDQQRVKLRVVPKWVLFPMEEPPNDEAGCVEVVNLSAFPVTLQEVGFTLQGEGRKGKRAVIAEIFTPDHNPFARRLESRQSVTGYFDMKTLPSNIAKAYVRTDCGEIAYGVSGALETLRRKAGRWKGEG